MDPEGDNLGKGGGGRHTLLTPPLLFPCQAPALKVMRTQFRPPIDLAWYLGIISLSREKKKSLPSFTMPSPTQ